MGKHEICCPSLYTFGESKALLLAMICGQQAQNGTVLGKMVYQITLPLVIEKRLEAD